MKKIGFAILTTIFASVAAAANVSCPGNVTLPTLTFTPDPIIVAKNQPFATTITISANPATQSGVKYVFSIKEAAVKGTNSSIGSSSGITSYKPDKGQIGNDSFQVRLEIRKIGSNEVCYIDGNKARVYLTVPVVIGTPTPPQAPSGTGGTASFGVTQGNISATGAVIIDNTANPGTPGIIANMNVKVGGARYLNHTNHISYDGLQVMQRQPDNSLWDEIGVTNKSAVSSGLFGSAAQSNYFVNGKPVIDLKRFRDAADWLRANVTPTASHPAGTYGTISWMEFVRNVAEDRPMYGIVRVLVPLKLKSGEKPDGTNDGSHDSDHDGHDDNENDYELNALKVNKPSNQIYAFCTQAEHDKEPIKDHHEIDLDDGHNSEGHDAEPPAVDGCGNAPIAGIEFEYPEPPKVYTANGYTFTNASRIRVYGTLFMDFVNAEPDAVNPVAGTPIEPDNLPFHPRDILIETAVPFNVNPAFDLDNDNVMDNLEFVDSLSAPISCTETPCTWKYPNPQTWSYVHVNATAKARFLAQTGVSLTQAVFDNLNTASKYHLFLPSGYEAGWNRALTELNITGQQWASLGFGVPSSALNSIPTEEQIMSPQWEDFPCYISTGGLFSMRGHVNFSGLLYIPQAIEMMQTYFNNARQYINGGIIVRDGFYIEGIHADPTLRGISIISSDPMTFSQIKINPSSVQTISSLSSFKKSSTAFSTKTAYSPMTSAGANAGGADTCVGCSGTTGTTVPQTKGNTFVIIRP